MSKVNIDAGLFHKRLSLLQNNLASEKNNYSSLLFLVGDSDDENTYKKTTVFQTWLLGYEFLHTGIWVTEDKCVIVTSEGKSKYLTHLTQKPTANSSVVEILPTYKDAEKSKENLVKFVKTLKELSSNERPIGHIAKDRYKGKLIDLFNEVSASQSLPYSDCALLISSSMEVKDTEELNNTRIASKASNVMMDVFANEMMVIVDEERQITNAALSEKIEDKIDSDKWFTKSAASKKVLVPMKEFNADMVDWCYSPIIQSGGEYDLKPSAQSTSKTLVGEGVIITSLGLRYNSYCSNVGRTFFINPTSTVDKNYDFLLQLQQHIVQELLKEGKKALEVYEGAVGYIKEKRPELVQHFTKNCGWLTGIEFRDSTFILNSKNERVLKNGQIFSLTIGFNDLDDEETKSANKKYSILLTDTVSINDTGAIMLTSYPKTKAEVAFISDEGTEVKKELDGQTDRKLKTEKDLSIEKSLAANEARSSALRSKLRNETANEDDVNSEKIRQEIQRKLHEKRQQEGLARYSKADAVDGTEQKSIFKRYESYVRESQIPSNVRDLRVHIDYRNQTIIVPIYGRPVPFHINAFKNGSLNDEGDFTYLRLNFNSPGAGGTASKKTELPYEDSPDSSFLRSITLRSRDRQRMIDVFKAIQDLKKDSVKREQERKQMSDVVAQANLIELKGTRVKKLDNVLIRPQPDPKKVGGMLQIHENGIRYQSSFKLDQKVDIIFSNIKHLFFQPSKDELIVLIHCHLKSPVIIGKRKTQDVQFYREASDIAFDETGGRKRRYRYGDEDELQQEQEERRRKALLDKEFRTFAELIADSSNGMVDLDIPFRELGFPGVPFRASVLCIPTRDCLVQLVDPPFLVITLDEIEIAYFERVQFGLKNFDLVLVFKDFNKAVVHINTIPIELLDDVKSWLTDIEIPYSEGQMNLNWGAIMKTITADPYQFFVDGGWSFISQEGSSDEEDEEEEESEFEASDADPSDEDEGSEAESEDNYSDEDASEDEGDEEEVSDEGEDWDETERKAANEDRILGREYR